MSLIDDIYQPYIDGEDDSRDNLNLATAEMYGLSLMQRQLAAAVGAGFENRLIGAEATKRIERAFIAMHATEMNRRDEERAEKREQRPTSWHERLLWWRS